MRSKVQRTALAVAVATILLATSLAGCLTGGDEEGVSLMLYGFSVKGEVMDGEVIPAFKRYWREETGEGVEFRTTYAGSGKVTKQVIAGAPVQLMVLSHELDALELREAGLATTDWNTFPHNGTLSKSPWVIIVRRGNPRGIEDFEDLTAPGVEIVHADPLTSGGARWSIFAQYGSVLQRTTVSEGAPNHTAAEALVAGIVANVISWQSSARNALSQFELGYGDAIITYECEAMLLRDTDSSYEIVYPRSTIYSEHKVVIVDANVKKGQREVVEAFVDFLYTEEAQRAMADHHFRSVDDAITAEHPEFPAIEMPFTIDYMGGWVTAQEELIDGLFSDLRD